MIGEVRQEKFSSQLSCEVLRRTFQLEESYLHKRCSELYVRFFGRISLLAFLFLFRKKKIQIARGVGKLIWKICSFAP